MFVVFSLHYTLSLCIFLFVSQHIFHLEQKELAKTRQKVNKNIWIILPLYMVKTHCLWSCIRMIIIGLRLENAAHLIFNVDDDAFGFWYTKP